MWIPEWKQIYFLTKIIIHFNALIPRGDPVINYTTIEEAGSGRSDEKT
jgi:hypothetical protein